MDIHAYTNMLMFIISNSHFVVYDAKFKERDFSLRNEMNLKSEKKMMCVTTPHRIAQRTHEPCEENI